MEQAPPTERELISGAQDQLRNLLPPGWQVESLDQAQLFTDATLRITAPDGRRALLEVEAKTLMSPRDVPFLVGQLGLRGSDGVLVVARYLSPRARDELVRAGLSYADSTGNLRVTLSDPGLAVIAPGANSDPYRSPDRPINSLRGTPASKVVRTLVDIEPPWTMRQLAAEAETSLASTARTIEFLDREALITRDEAGSVVDVDWEGLLRRWAEDYELGSKRRIVRAVAPRGLDAAEEALRRTDVEYVISGSLAARRLAVYAEARTGLIYARSADRLVAAIGAREAPSRPNLLVIEPARRQSPDDSMFLRPREEDGLRFAGVSQVAVDLLAGPGRNPEEGLALIDWMRRNELDWRRS